MKLWENKHLNFKMPNKWYYIALIETKKGKKTSRCQCGSTNTGLEQMYLNFEKLTLRKELITNFTNFIQRIEYITYFENRNNYVLKEN